jgi:hypothetical protein
MDYDQLLGSAELRMTISHIYKPPMFHMDESMR